MPKEITKRYIRERFPKKHYRFLLRPRKPFGLYWSEIVFVILILLMIFMVITNFMEEQKYTKVNLTRSEKEIKVGVSIEELNTQGLIVQAAPENHESIRNL